MKNLYKKFAPCLILTAITIILIYLDTSFAREADPSSRDIVSEFLMCLQPVMWLVFGGAYFKNTNYNLLMVFGIIILYSGMLQDLMDEFYELEGLIGDLENYLVPVGLIFISAAVILTFMDERKIPSQISQKSIRDPLTGMYNRFYLEEKLESILDESIKGNYEISVAFIDIDNFKKVNDAEGHRKGDELLKYIGTLINNSIRESDCAFRYGGDEFLIVYQNTSAEIALEITERIKNNLKKNILYHSYNLSLSSGIASYQGSENYKDLINRADQAMYKSKMNGRDQATIAVSS